MKVDKTVKQETINIIIGTIILSAMMEAVFLVIGKWDYTVLLGNLWGAFGAVMNFFLMGMTVQSAVMKEEEDARLKMKSSLVLRTQMMFVIALIGAIAPCFNVMAVLIPMFFPRIVITCRGFALNKQQACGGEKSE